jgi:eukaryotic-like serine/threonine-protein kinase
MDKVKAQLLEEILAGKTIQAWTIRSLISNGKSAAVFLADGPEGEVAVKIFDTELINRYGDGTQIARIEREQQLVGKSHPNLVEILGGGFDNITNNYFIVMKYLKGPNLKECLQDIPAEQIPALIQQIASAARFLEEHGYVHRDIKPENIAIVDNYQKAVLLDLGVLRPLSGSDLTDDEGIQAFIGTLQYSSPEFLLRQEEQTTDGYRSLTFYQLGAVLHDLIMRKPLFADLAEPYARSVNAVQQETPEIQNTGIPYYLVELARFCLLKQPQMRLRLVTWDSFSPPATEEVKGRSIKQRVTNRTVAARARTAEDGSQDRITFETLKREALSFLMRSARTIRSENSALPPIRVLAKTPHDLSFGIQFSGSTDSSLIHELTIFVELKILDCSARVIQLNAWAWSGVLDRSSSHPTPLQIFQGTYDGQATYTALEDCIYDIVDQVQEAYSQGGSPTWIFPRRAH